MLRGAARDRADSAESPREEGSGRSGCERWDDPGALAMRSGRLPGDAPGDAPGGGPEDRAVAIVGMACRFPGGGDLEEFRDLLARGGDAVEEGRPGSGEGRIGELFRETRPAPDPRRFGAFVEGVDLFDAAFFGISGAEARLLDPQQRLLLETSWRALEHAAIPPDTLRGTRTAVFAGIGISDYRDLLPAGDAETIYAATGTSASTAAGRVAFALGFEGPALSVDTASSSSLVAVHQAVLALQQGDATLALAGGVNVIASSRRSEMFVNGGILAPGGRCRSFDASADGYVRGEGCGMVVLKRLSLALVDGDRILAVIRGSAVNQDGASGVLTAPHGPSQERVIAAALARAGVSAEEVDYLEAHGTGTPLGDVTELGAAGRAYGRGRRASRPLLVGSAKTNIGHLEAAAGVAGLIKAVLALESGEIPAHLHFREPNPEIAWAELPVRVAEEAIPWPDTGGRPRRAGVSSYGISGTNAHLVLEAAPAPEAGVAAARRRRLLPLSAKSGGALRGLAEKYLGWCEGVGEEGLADLAWTAGVGRTHFACRRGVVFGDRAELTAGLRELAASAGELGAAGEARRVAFLFTGAGSQWAGMGREEYEGWPVARAVLDRCEAVCREERGESLLEVMFGDSGDLDEPEWGQPALYALQSALSALWVSVGVGPAVLFGHSFGEVAAAGAAGVFGLESGLRFALRRGALVGSLPAGGAMAAVFAPPASVEAELRKTNARVSGAGLSLAAENGSHAVVSGPRRLVSSLRRRLGKRGVRVERLATRHAFHSALMDPILDELEAAAEDLAAGKVAVPLVSGVTGALVEPGGELDAGYWRGQARLPVVFAKGVGTLAELGVDVAVEIGPRAVLGPLARGLWPSSGAPLAVVASRHGGSGEPRGFVEGVAAAYEAGVRIEFAGLAGDEGRRRVPAPGYAFQRERHWVDTPPDSPAAVETGPPEGVLVARLRDAPEAERRGLLLEYVLGEVREMLRLPGAPPPETGFFELGMDSLLVAELRNRVNRAVWGAGEITESEVFSHPNAARLAARLAAGFRAPARPRAVRVEADGERVAVVGIACRFPGGRDPEGFWRTLSAGGDRVTRGRPGGSPAGGGEEVPFFGAFLEEVDRFDAGFFRIAPLEAELMDPQQRLLLEVSWEALEDAGIAPAGLAGSRTGVYAGMFTSDYRDLVPSGAGGLYRSTGSSFSAAIGRVSYAFGFEGPAVALDTACSSSLVALHQASVGLLRGEADVALAGGVNVILGGELTSVFREAGMLSADGRCKTFDASADGYVRGEGCGMVVLKRLADAERDGDRVLGVVLGSAVNQDGASAGLTVPNGGAQERVIGEALARAGLEPREVDYLEAHGTGTALGDPIEVEAASAVYGEGRDAERPLLLGSVKTNVGHLEAAAGIAGVIKVLLSLSEGLIPPQLHFETPNPRIAWEELPVRVVSEAESWPAAGRTRRAAVSSFGYSGTNAHVILESYEEQRRERGSSERHRPPEANETPEVTRSHRLLPISGKTPGALRDLAARYLAFVTDATPLGDLAWTAGVGRNHFGHRAGVVFHDLESLRAGLARVEQGAGGEVSGAKVAFRSTGRGRPWAGMGRELYESEPVFREVVDRCEAAFAEERGESLLPVLFGELEGRDGPEWTQPALGALESGLKALWASVGVMPDVEFGDGEGELPSAAALVESGAGVVIEIGPATASGSTASLSWPDGKAPAVVSSPVGGASGAFAAAVGSAYEAGVEIAFAGLFTGEERRRVSLPTYPFQRERYWVRGPQRRRAGGHPLLGVRRDGRDGEVSFETELAAEDPAWLGDHRVFGEVVAPAALYAAQALEALREAGRGPGMALGEMQIHRPLVLSSEGRTVQVVLDGENRWEVVSREGSGGTIWDLHAEGRTGSGGGEPGLDIAALRKRLSPVEVAAAYRRFVAGGIEYGAAFRALAGLWSAPGEALGEVSLPPEAEAGGLMAHPALLDGCFQVVYGASGGEEDLGGWLPIGWERLWLGGALPERLVCHVRLGKVSGEVRKAELGFYGPSGEALGGVTGFTLKRANRAALLGSGVDELLYGVEWRAARERELASIGGDGERESTPGLFVLAGGGPFAAEASREVAGRGQQVASGPTDGGREAWGRFFASLPDGVPLRGVVHLEGVREDGAEASVGELRRELEAVGSGALSLVQGLADAGVTPSSGVWFVTRGGQVVDRETAGALAAATLWGFGSVVALEHGDLRPRLLDLDPEEPASASVLADELLRRDGETRIAWRSGERRVARLVRLPPGGETGDEGPAAAGRVRGDRSYLVTGGLGGIGLEVAGWLAEAGAGAVVLAGRRPADEAGEAAVSALRRRGAAVRVEVADLTDGEAVEAMLARVAAELPPLGGVIHGAGVLADGALVNLDWGRFEEVLDPKALGAWRLHRATRDLDLDLFVMFSSVAGVLGNPGQANHAAANAFLDQLARHRRALGLPGQTVAWGAWSGVGQAEEARARIAEQLEAQGEGWIRPERGLRALTRVVREDLATSLVASVNWSRLPSRPPWLEELVSTAADPAANEAPGDLAERVQGLSGAEREAALLRFVVGELASVLRLREAPSAETGFFELGMDSLMAVELRNRVNRALAGAVVLPATAAFDYPNATRLAHFLARELEGAPPARRAAPAAARGGDERIAVVGMACRFPGGADPEAFWGRLAAGEDLVTRGRPDGLYVDAETESVRPWGAYVEGLDRFDAEFFRIAPLEAELLDPQQRLLLEVSWAALEDAGRASGELAGSRTGVYVGIMNDDYRDLTVALAGDPSRSLYQTSGATFSTAAGRVAFALGLMGPTLALDTACSSSLVALHQAAGALRQGEADLALAGGVNAILRAERSRIFRDAGMLGGDGRCKTFDAAADGYGRGEGCGMVVLKRLSDAEADGDRILGVLLGSAVNQDGASAGLTVPNGPAQERVIGEALARAGIEPSSVDYLEAHGTGTPLGDPIEVAAAGAVYGEGREADRPLLLGSVKTNVGHLESAAGMAGLVKVLLAMRRGVIPRHLHFETPNPRIAWDDLPVRVVAEATPWPAADRPRRAAVSSFGYSGTNAHVVLEGWERRQSSRWGPSDRHRPPGADETPCAPRTGRVLPISGKTPGALRDLAGRYLAFLTDDAPLADMAWTAGVGRNHFAHRAGVVFHDLESLRAGLARVKRGAGGEASGGKVAFRYTGWGSRWSGMGRELYETEPVFREVVDRSEAAFAEELGESLLPVLFGESEGPARPEWTQPALRALESALAALWASVGVTPDMEFGRGERESSAMEALLESGVRVVVEIGPAAAPGSASSLSWPDGGAPAVVASAVGGESGAFATAVGAAYEAGLDIAFGGLFAGERRRRVSLPTYPFQRRRHWVEAPKRRGRAEGEHPLLGVRWDSRRGDTAFEIELDSEAPVRLLDHRVFGEMVAPGALFAAQALEALREMGRGPTGSLTGVHFHRPLVFREGAVRAVQVLVDPEGRFEVASRVDGEDWDLHAEGGVRPAADAGPRKEVGELRAGLAPVPPEEFYARVAERGIGYGPAFRVVGALWTGPRDALAEVALPAESGLFGTSAQPVLLDGCFQTLLAASELDGGDGAWLPFGWESLWLAGPLPERFWCRARLAAGSGEARKAELAFYGPEGEALGGISGFTLKRAARASFLRSGVEDLLYEVAWRDGPPVGPLPADFLREPEAVRTGLAPLDRYLDAEGMDREAAAALGGDLERASRGFAQSALGDLGWERRPGATFEAEALRRRLKVTGDHRRLFGRLLELVEEAGSVRREPGGGWRVADEPAPPSAASARSGESPEQALLERCGASLAEVLRGRADPLPLLFGDPPGAAEVYRDSGQLRAWNRMVGDAVGAAVGALPPDRRLRVLEVGAGTGATTAAVLAAVPPERTDYEFTDISAGFFAAAERRFEGNGAAMRYRALDIERDPLEQGFAGHGYDLVVAANVLHATRDLEEALRRCRELLAPAGLLVALEGVRRQGWLDLTFGLLPGWWRFDDRYREETALVGVETWRRALREAGYAETAFVADELGQALFLARAPAEAAPAPGRFVLAGGGAFGDALAGKLSRFGQRVEIGPAAGADRESWRRFFASLPDDPPLRGVAYLAGVGAEGSAVTDGELREELTSTGSGALALVQGCVDAGVRPSSGLWFVTQGAQVVEREAAGVLSGATLWGFANVVAIEGADLKPRLVDLDPEIAPSVDALAEELLYPDCETRVARRGGRRRVARLVRKAERPALPAGSAWRLAPGPGGALDRLRVEELRLAPLGAREIRVAVEAAGVNFLDVMVGMELVDALPTLGGEVCGRVVGVGSQVEEFAEGDRVLGFAPGAFAPEAVTRAELVAPAPAGLSAAALATVPVAYATAELAFEFAGLSRGDRVLVHAGTGGVGHAAIRLAQAAGLRVLATASAPKQEYLRSLGVEGVFNSRDTGFGREVRAATGGQGVAMVLNSLTGEGFVEASLECLTPGGSFVEMGKRGIWNASRMEEARPDVAYRILFVDRMIREEPERLGAVLRSVVARIAAGALACLPYRRWPLAETGGALEFMREARHVGKLVLAPSALASGHLRRDRSYLVTGGLGGIGLEVARWLAERGAGAVVLNGRRAPDARAEAAVAALRERGVEVRVELADVTDGAAVDRLVAGIGPAAGLPPLGGVIHSVGALADASLVNQDWAGFERVLWPKVLGAWRLHRATEEMDLELFVLFSSVAGVLGNAGQANHAAANAFLDQLALHRRALGLPGQAIQWGAWSGLGEAEEQRARIEARLAAGGWGWVAPAEGLRALEMVVREDAGSVVAASVDWTRFGAARVAASPFFAELVKRRRDEAPAEREDFASRLRAAPATGREELALAFVREEARSVLRLPAAPPAEARFFDLGMDSLMAVELRNRLNRALGGSGALSNTVAFDYPNSRKLARHLREVLGGAAEATKAHGSGEPEPPPPLSVEEFAEMLVDLEEDGG